MARRFERSGASFCFQRSLCGISCRGPACKVCSTRRCCVEEWSNYESWFSGDFRAGEHQGKENRRAARRRRVLDGRPLDAHSLGRDRDSAPCPCARERSSPLRRVTYRGEGIDRGDRLSTVSSHAERAVEEHRRARRASDAPRPHARGSPSIRDARTSRRYARPSMRSSFAPSSKRGK